MKALVIVAALSGTARADLMDKVDEVSAGVTLHYEATGLRSLDEMSRPADLFLAGARVGGYVGKSAPVGYYVNLDVFAGSTIHGGGFAYDVALSPIGVAVRLGKTGLVGVTTGIGASGAIGTLDDALVLPVTVTAEVGRSWRLIGRARISYLAFADARQSGAPNVPADELDAMLAIRIGHAYTWDAFKSGNGVFVGASYREQAGVRFAGVTLGYSIDGALPHNSAR
jgi:hypothetical protein